VPKKWQSPSPPSPILYPERRGDGEVKSPGEQVTGGRWGTAFYRAGKMG